MTKRIEEEDTDDIPNEFMDLYQIFSNFINDVQGMSKTFKSELVTGPSLKKKHPNKGKPVKNKRELKMKAKQ